MSSMNVSVFRWIPAGRGVGIPKRTCDFLKNDFDVAATLPVAGTSYLVSVNSFDTFRMMLQVVF